MNIKLPACYDVSHWEDIPDFTLVSPKPLLFITKATEHISFVDSKFVRFFAGMKQIGVRRGAYHFHRKAFKETDQAEHFCNTVRNHIGIDDILILDVEEGGETAALLKIWLEFVQLQFPENLVMLYSRKSLLDVIPMSYAEREFFKLIPTWVAGYPANPDALLAMPSYYMPDQSKYGPCWLWQYSDKGQVAGITGDVDLNWIDPVFVAILDDGGSTPPPVGGEMDSFYLGTVMTSMLNVRNVPSSASSTSIVMQVLRDQHLVASEVVNGWWKLTHIENQPLLQDLYAFEGTNNGYIRRDAVVSLAGIPADAPEIHLTSVGNEIYAPFDFTLPKR